MWEIILSFLISTSLAQGFDANKAYQDYQYSLEVYNQANTSFENAKAFYLTNKTLTLKEEARKKLVIMLKSRDQLEIVYLTALRMKILQTNGSFGKIDSEVEWYKNHINNYKDNDPTEDLFNKNSEAESRYKTDTSPIINEALFIISLGEETKIRQDHEDIYANLKSMITDPNPFNRWIIDIDSVLLAIKQSEDLSKTQIEKSYDTAIETLDSSLKPLSQLNKFLTEVLTSIKNQQ